MPALDFPDSPNVGDTFLNWEWDGSKWTALAHHWSPPEAPVDHKTYGRRDREWEQVLPIEGGTLTGDLIVHGHTELGSTLAAGQVGLEVARDSIFHGMTTVRTPLTGPEAANKDYVDTTAETTFDTKFAEHKHAQAITGNGIDAQFDVDHNLNTLDVLVEVFDDNRNLVLTDVQAHDPDAVMVSFAIPPVTGKQYHVVVLG